MAAAKKQKRTLGAISDDIIALDNEIKGLTSKVDALKTNRGHFEKELMEAAEKEGINAGKGDKSAFNIAPEILPSVSDWDKFYQFIIKNKYLHLLQKRPTTLACREFWEQGKEVPGVDKFMRIKVTVKEI